MSARRLERGFTLFELMTAAAVGLIIVLAGLAAFDIQDRFARNTERLLGTQATSSLALTMMQRDLENAGLRFRGGAQDAGGPQWAAVVRPYDNLGGGITQLINDTSGGNLVAVAGTNAGFIPGTDAFEVLLGSQRLEPARLGAGVGSVIGWGTSTLTVSVAPNPFTANENAAAGTNGPLLMFWNDDVHCIGRMVGTGTAILVARVNADLVNSGAIWANATPQCPASGMRVEILQTRRRYLVYQSASTTGRPARLGLYLQTNDFCDPADGGAACNTNLGAPRIIAEGVDDLQVAWRVPGNWGPDGGIWCEHSPTELCGFDQPNAQASQLAAQIIGAQIYVSSRGSELLLRPNEPVPHLLNHIPTPATDGIVRSIMQTGVLFRNVVNP
jgi:prepilin-type N-terminal cleavage/methylation domain-containing protein